MDLELNERVVCITGGSRGIGLATARLFATEGATVVIAARRQEKLKEAIEEIKRFTGKTIEAVQTDVTRESDIAKLIEYIESKHGRLDILVNNAGTGIYKSFSEVTSDELQHGMAINFFAQFKV